MSVVDPRTMANAIRALAMDAVEKAKSGHPGMPMGMADVATVLYTKFLKHDPANPHWPDRDRFVLSAGHGSMLLYSLLHLTGYEDFPLEQLENFRQWGARTAGHPEYGHGAGIETTTGPLGQGIANSVGMALAERMLNARFGDALVDHYTYVIAGDGCLMEGISHEAISLAGHLKLGKLIVLFDDNGISIDGPTSLTVSDDQMKRFEACGWDVRSCDGHDFASIEEAIEAARATDRPSLIACKTVIGFGAPNKQGSSSTHGAPLGPDEIAAAREMLGWPYGPFEIPDEILEAWRAAGIRTAAERMAWEKRFDALPPDVKKDWTRGQKGDLGSTYKAAIDDFKKSTSADQPKLATRTASQKVLDVIAGHIPELVGGSADLTGSNNTKAKTMQPVSAESGYEGGYIYWGVREHGMAAAMNGMALHKGLIPYGGTFLVFTDYCRPSIRLAALMGIRSIFVMTHDSIGLGEDGPTHQPVEHMAALRAIPNLVTMRPADAVETAECWQIALENSAGPSVLALTRQNLPTLRTEHTKENLSARGGYVLKEAEGAQRKATIMASGSEVEIAMAAREALQAEGVPTAVVSMPSMELFDRQDAEYRSAVLGEGTVRVAVEAAIRQGWDRYLGDNGAFVGMTGFGASAPYQELYEQFGITAKAVAEAVRSRI